MQASNGCGHLQSWPTAGVLHARQAHAQSRLTATDVFVPQLSLLLTLALPLAVMALIGCASTAYVMTMLGCATACESAASCSARLRCCVPAPLKRIILTATGMPRHSPARSGAERSGACANWERKGAIVCRLWHSQEWLERHTRG